MPQGTVEKKKKKSKAQHKRSRSAYKPYHLLTWEEKKRLAKVEEEKALKRVKEYEALGGKAAPHNTTQFIIEESEQGMDFDREASPVPSRLSELNAIDPDGSEVDEEQAEQYVESDFEDQFNVVQRDMFSQMTKQELIDHCIETHREREFLSSKLARLEVDFQRIREENERIKKKVLEDQVNIITRRGTNYPPPPLFRQESEPGENSTSNSIGSSVAAGENSVSDSAESVGEDVGSQSVAGAGAQDNSVCGDERAISLADSGVAEQSGMEI